MTGPIKPHFSNLDELAERFFPTDGMPVLNDAALRRPGSEIKFPGKRNKLGYRADEFDDRGDFNIVYLGCSWVEGSGVTREQLFSDRVSEHLASKTGLKIRSWNLGLNGSSIDYASRLLPNALNVLRPDLVVIVLTALDRREHFTEDGRGRAYMPNMANIDVYKANKIWIPEQDLPAINALKSLSNVNADTGNFLRTFRLWQCALDAARTPFVFTSIDHPPLVRVVKKLLNSAALPRNKFLGHLHSRTPRPAGPCRQRGAHRGQWPRDSRFWSCRARGPARDSGSHP
jgi:hypothetical protein